MNLHAVNDTIHDADRARQYAATAQDEEEEDEEEQYTCRHCEGHNFQRQNYGTYTELQTFDTDRDRVDWQDQDNHEIQDHGDFECSDCGWSVTDQDLLDHLEDMF